MSSDSEDDYSYTNSVSVLKALTKKKDKNSDCEVTPSKQKHEVNFFDSPDLVSRRESKKVKQISDNNKCIDLDDIKSNVENDSCMIISDSEADLTPVNIISAIDNVLKNSKRKPRQGKRKAVGKTRQTRQTKRMKKSEPIHSEVCIIDDDDLDVNEVNFELTVKVFWKSQYLEKFTMKRFDKLRNIFKHFSEKENVPENRLLFTIKDIIISKDDTPQSLNITAATIIEGGVLSAKSDISGKKQSGMEFKIQLKDRKQPLLISMKPEDKMEILMVQCSEELNVPVKKLKFYFDGEIIKSNDTPECLDLEGGEIIDCVKT